MGNRYFKVYKPYDMVSQFVSPHPVRLLTEINFDFPEGTHAVGRLDNHSEGLLILTTNKKVTRLLFESNTAHERTYLVQVSPQLSTGHLEQLQLGVSIQIQSGLYYTTRPCTVSIIRDPENLFHLEDRLTAFPPFTWILITVSEGKYHQVRKMITAIGQKCKRLIRTSIEDLELGHLKPGDAEEMEESEFFKRLKIPGQ